jgi:hypothetical protein
VTYPRFALQATIQVGTAVALGLLAVLGGGGWLDSFAEALFSIAVVEAAAAAAFAAWTWRNQRRHGVTLATRWYLLSGAWLLGRVALRADPLRAVELAPRPPTPARDR